MKRAALYSAVLFFVACSQGGNGTFSPTGAPPAQTTELTGRVARSASIHFKFRIPRRHHRHSHYVSYSTQSVSIDVYDAAHTSLLSRVVANVGPASNGCSVVSSFYRCTVDVTTRPGADTFDVATFDHTGGTGQALSALTDFPFTVRSGKANVIPLTLGGLATSFSFVPSNTVQAAFSNSVLSITGTKPQQITIVPLDADGNWIVGPGAPIPVINPTPPSTTLKTPSPAQPNVWTLTSTFTTSTSPLTPDQVSLSVRATPVPGSGGSTVLETIPLQLYQPWVYVIDATNKVLAFDESGNGKTLSGSAFSGLNTAYSATFVPTTNWIYVSDAGANAMKVFDVLGNAAPIAGSPFPNLSSPWQSAFDSDSDYLYVANNGNNTITAYDAQGNQQSLPGYAFVSGTVMPNGPSAIASDGNIYVANRGNNSAAGYTGLGYQLTDNSHFPNISGPAQMTFDPNNSFFYLANSGSAITVYDVYGTQQSLSGSFSNVNQPYGVTYDPYNGLLYVGNYGGPSVTVYDELGNQQTLGGSAFSGLSGPYGVLIVP